MEKEEKKQSQVKLAPCGSIEEVPGDNEEPLEWYFSWGMIILSFFVAGPLCLLLLWFRPRTTLRLKILLSILVLAMTIWMTYGAVVYYQTMVNYFEQLELQI